MATTPNLNRLSGPDQVQVLKALRQATAAWLLDIRPRSLRDAIDAPRSNDGRYDGQQLVKWARGRMERCELTDDDVEKCLRIADSIVVGNASGVSALKIVNMLHDTREKYADQGLLAFIDILMTKLTEAAEWFPPPTAEEVERERLVARRREEYSKAERELRIVTVCEKCERIRHGRRWLKRRPPADHAVTGDLCPDCTEASKAK